jgi:endonuclease/exonuclease/phosphatase family metal-dependent hydrolase
MARKDTSLRTLQQLFTAFMRLPFKVRIVLVVVALVAGVVVLTVQWVRSHPHGEPSSSPSSTGPKNVIFCVWNMENLFDDKDDKRRHPDEEYDSWFVNDPAARTRKYERLTEALLRLNAGNGPDIIVGNEIESPRAAELLKDALNEHLPAGAAHYEFVAMKELDAGRHIAPCVISRYPLSRAKLLGRRQRILEVHVTVNDHDLWVVASHWTSQLSDKGTDETRGRFAYADTIHAEYSDAIGANPTVDFLVCGDFNDTPDAPSITQHLHMVGDAKAVTVNAHPPLLYGLLSGKSPREYGTHYYGGKPLIYDHIAISPGLFDDTGWGYSPDSVNVPTAGLIRQGSTGRRPWRYGSRNDDALGRGFSDHFPVVATLKVAG